MKLFSNRHRPVHLGPYPLERLPRTDVAGNAGPIRSNTAGAKEDTDSPVGAIADDYIAVYTRFARGESACEKADLDTLDRDPTEDLKAGLYFLDASFVGICSLEADDGTGGEDRTGRFGIAIGAAWPRAPEAGTIAERWTNGDRGRVASLRAAELAVVAANYIRALGWDAAAHVRGDTDIDLEALAVRAGIAEAVDEGVVSPYVGASVSFAGVVTDYPLRTDRPLAPGACRGARDWRWWLGVGGTVSGLEKRRIARRASHDGIHPMEKIRRVDEPTTLVLADEVPRVPKRAAFFERALRGDLGPKAQRERTRFATKHPFAFAMTPLIRSLVPHQDGEVADERPASAGTAGDYSRAIKSLGYYLGADLVGISEAHEHAWFSHREDGTPIDVRHRYAIVMLIDQGHDTMEGSSGDDWISGAQSMRSYLRGAEMAGVMAAVIRGEGHSARAQTNLDSDVLHIPLILSAGLGELSRIGELVLNPFVGPRFKSVVVTTDLPLEPDRPIDFGLQDMCEKCLKCARECPCSAIPFGPKVMFNGYEIWKPDVQRCTSYRVTNAKGSACGRCMKTCPYNHEGLLWFKPFLWMAIHLPFTRKWIADMDDRIGNGSLNPVKKWWFDLEIVDGVARKVVGANARNLSPGKHAPDPGKSPIAVFPAAAMPPPDATDPVPVDRKAGLEAAKTLETPDSARARRGL